jgi:DNA-binding NarL/FixJ family response regulator
MEMRTLVIIEDHPVMRKSLAAYFEGTGRWRVLGSFPNLEDAETFLIQSENAADIFLLDIQLEKGWGLDIIPWLRCQNSEKTPAIVIYSNYTDYAHVNAALSLGIQGYVSKSRNEEELEAVLETVLQGGHYIDKTVERELAAISDAVSLLTKREGEIFTLVKSGLHNKQIAGQLGISRRTVENILSSIYDKIGISSRMELQKL